jgi:hypothetical protein
MIWNKFESIGFILADKYQKHWRQRCPEILGIPGPVIRRPNIFTRGEGKTVLQTFQRKMERRILQIVCSDRQTDESSNKKENQNNGTRGSGSQSEVKRRRPYGKNEPVQVDRHCNSVGRTDRRRRNGRPKTLWADKFKRVAGGQWSRNGKS